MRLTVRGQRVELDDALKSHIDLHVYFALSRFSDRIRSVHVALSDSDGPRGGVDKVCRMRVALRSGPPLHLEELASTLEMAVDRACDRLGRRVARELERQRELSRGRASLSRAASAPAAGARGF